MTWWKVLCTLHEAVIVVNGDNVITRAWPEYIANRFVGSKYHVLTRWMRMRGGFEISKLDTLVNAHEAIARLVETDGDAKQEAAVTFE